jgi:hypothetical protein
MLNPNQADVRQRLDLVRIGNQWVDRTTIARKQQRVKEAREAYEHWLPIITKLAPQLSSPDLAKREAATEQVLAIRDPAALPTLQELLGSRGEAQEMLVLRVCQNLPDLPATELIAWLAMECPAQRVRQEAARLLQQRDPADYAPLLIAEMYAPVQTKVESMPLSNGSVGLRRSFFREGATHVELFVSEARFDPRGVRNSPAGNSPLNSVLLQLAQAEAGARLATMSSDVAVEEQNRQTQARNERITEALVTATGEKLAPQPELWWKWWMELNELAQPDGKDVRYRYQFNQVDVQKAKTYSGNPYAASEIRLCVSCFNAGTPVWTDQGPVAIERLQIGDLVLSRDVETGELTYKPVLLTTVRAKRRLTALTVGEEKIQATGGHLFWVSGSGWVRAKELKSSDVLHTATNPISVTATEPGIIAETYNLVVADFHTYFVGQQKLLTHDNTPRQYTSVVVPGLKPE